MSEEEIDRKIAVIFATDVVGYRKQMEADESGTVKNLQACKKNLLDCLRNIKPVCLMRTATPFLLSFQVRCRLLNAQ